MFEKKEKNFSFFNVYHFLGSHFYLVDTKVETNYIVPPFEKRLEIIERIHRDCGHLNGENLRNQILLQGFKWKGMLKQVKKYSKRNCRTCRELSAPKVFSLFSTFISLLFQNISFLSNVRATLCH